MNLSGDYPNVVEFPRPLKPGDRIGSDERRVFEVRQLSSTLTLAGEERELFVAVHEKDGAGRSVTLFVSLHGSQRSWWLLENIPCAVVKP